jgi:hypothetical protein
MILKNKKIAEGGTPKFHDSYIKDEIDNIKKDVSTLFILIFIISFTIFLYITLGYFR